MKHLSCEQVLTLSGKLVGNKVFSREDELAMLHIAYCEECYNLLQCTIALKLLWNGQVFSSWPKTKSYTFYQESKNKNKGEVTNENYY